MVRASGRMKKSPDKDGLIRPSEKCGVETLAPIRGLTPPARRGRMLTHETCGVKSLSGLMAAQKVPISCAA